MLKEVDGSAREGGGAVDSITAAAAAAAAAVAEAREDLLVKGRRVIWDLEEGGFVGVLGGVGEEEEKMAEGERMVAIGMDVAADPFPPFLLLLLFTGTKEVCTCGVEEMFWICCLSISFCRPL